MTASTLDLTETCELTLLLAGDEEAFRRLVKLNHRTLFSVARSVVDDSMAEEVVQEAWIAIYDNLKGFKGESNIKTWMYRITINKALSRLRHESKHKCLSSLKEELENDEDFFQRFSGDGSWRLPLGEWEENNPERVLTRDELQECIDMVMEALPKNQRLVFSLSQIEGESTESICNLMKISTSNMKVLLHRARIRLFSHIANFQEAGEC